MTLKSCAVGMCNAIPRNHLKIAYICIFKGLHICITSSAEICETNAKYTCSTRTHTFACENAGLVNYVVYNSTKCARWENGYSCMIAMKITLTKNCQYGSRGKMPCLWSICYLRFVTRYWCKWLRSLKSSKRFTFHKLFNQCQRCNFVFYPAWLQPRYL